MHVTYTVLVIGFELDFIVTECFQIVAIPSENTVPGSVRSQQSHNSAKHQCAALINGVPSEETYKTTEMNVFFFFFRSVHFFTDLS